MHTKIEHKNIFWSIATMGTRALSGFGFFVLLAKETTVGEFGLIAYYYSLSLVLGLFVDYGYNLRLLNQLRSHQGRESIEIDKSTGVKIVNSVIIAAAVLFVDQNHKWLFATFMAGQVLNHIGSTLLVYFRHEGRFRSEAKFVVMNNGISFGVFVIAYALDMITVYTLPICILVGKVILLVAFLAKHRINLRNATITNILDEYKYGFSYFMHASVGVAYLNLDSIMLKHYVDLESVGLYQASAKTLLAAVLFCDVLVNYFHPYLLRSWDNRSENMIFRHATAIKLYFYISGLVFSIVFFMALKLYPHVIFDSEFIFDSELIFLLSIVVYLRYFGGFWGILLTISSKQHVRVYGGLMSIAVLALTMAALAPKYGIFAAALATLFAHLAINVIYLWQGKKCLQQY